MIIKGCDALKKTLTFEFDAINVKFSTRSYTLNHESFMGREFHKFSMNTV